jgi:hypothetical protein
MITIGSVMVVGEPLVGERQERSFASWMRIGYLAAAEVASPSGA